MESHEVLNIVEQYAPTGKTAKFVNDNVTGASNLKIVTSDPICGYIHNRDYFKTVKFAKRI